jgi:hypothetical protein
MIKPRKSRRKADLLLAGYLLGLFFDPEGGGTVILRHIGKIFYTNNVMGHVVA